MQGKVLNLFDDHFADSTDRTVCKFVLVRCGEEVHMVFGPQHEYPYHASLIERFCGRYEIASGWEHRPDRYEIYDHDCEILGGGYLDLSPAFRRASAYGFSTAYGGFPVPEFRLAAGSGRFFEGWAITVQ
jgi:hypothetical protein